MKEQKILNNVHCTTALAGWQSLREDKQNEVSSLMAPGYYVENISRNVTWETHFSF